MKTKSLLVSTLMLIFLGESSFSQSNSFPTNGDVLIQGSQSNLQINNTSENESGIIFSDYQDISGYQVAKIMFNSNTTADNKFNFYMGDDQTNPRMTIDYTGNVGIANTTPWARLHIKGNGTQPALYLDGVSRDISYMGNLQIGTWNGTTWTERMRILSNGNVGIGCADPQVKLAVNGTIKATELDITTAPCSDFVFETGYKLMDLNTLEKFVANNKHLPDVPSAKEFEENGYRVGEMDDLLLRKIEELTLYIINQQKELINQQNEIVKQQNEIEELKSKLK